MGNACTHCQSGLSKLWSRKSALIVYSGPGTEGRDLFPQVRTTTIHNPVNLPGALGYALVDHLAQLRDRDADEVRPLDAGVAAVFPHGLLDALLHHGELSVHLRARRVLATALWKTVNAVWTAGERHSAFQSVTPTCAFFPLQPEKH